MLVESKWRTWLDGLPVGSRWSRHSRARGIPTAIVPAASLIAARVPTVIVAARAAERVTSKASTTDTAFAGTVTRDVTHLVTFVALTRSTAAAAPTSFARLAGLGAVAGQVTWLLAIVARKC